NTEQFRKEGCENCESFLQFKRHPERVQECTTLMKPDDSWVSRYKKIGKLLSEFSHKPFDKNHSNSAVATRSENMIPELVEDEMAQRNIPYIPRD
ncbi:18419_t:CDS:2, partial [Racocetra fulgida]